MKILLQNYTTKELLTPAAYQLNEMVKQLKLIPMFSLSTDCNYQKSLTLVIKSYSHPHTSQIIDLSKMTCSVVTVSKCFLSIGFGRFCRKNLVFRFRLGFHDKRVVNFFVTRVIWHDFHHH